ncbi:pilus assembly protein PilP [Aquisalimonas asiatica]|uniref:Type IV pilus assembly protein PilP n=1 Tax=Aquisalimonas asiatica TaxID=406100 RepID=A0A1H8TFH7_9GAMM|nr:pilus assembly protein PilP [Aquisalimonas asiatica]SEO89869.1 type IV pilus assembly protein PilP [Aquisalimonas asiatica]
MRTTASRLHPMHMAAVIALMALVLGGCSRDTDDLDEYIEDIHDRPARALEPVPEPEPARSHRYPDLDIRNPFAPLSFAEPDDDGDDAADGPTPDRDRPREPLEAFALDSMRMTGILEQDGSRWALIRDPSGTVHRVQEGNYLGENHGEIKRITEQRVDILELVPAQDGGWRERDASLTTRE